MTTKERVFEICRKLDKQVEKITVDNVITQSLFSTGGTLGGMDREVSFYIELYQTEKLISIGFCQPKYYKRSVWLKAKKVMDDLCKINIGVKPYDYGRGKGKYTYEGDMNFQQLADTLIKHKIIL